MASVEQLLASIPDGPEYNALRATIERIGALFPGELAEITASRVAGWVDEIATGSGRGRDADQIRDDIFKHIVGVDVIMEVLGVDEKTANDLILGGNDGGINFSDLDIDPETGQVRPGATDVPTEEGVRPEEDQTEEGVGGEGPDEETALTILTSEEMEWFFDPSSGKWYVSYGLPGSDRALVFEADPDQMDSLFGEDMRPTNYSERQIGDLLADDNYIYGENIAAMAGTGSFEDEIAKVQAIALDNGKLPDWASETGEIMDLVYVAQAYGKTQDWLYEEIAKTEEFQMRFPDIEKFKAEHNLTLKDAISGFLEYEASVRSSLTAAGFDEGLASPDAVGALLTKGYSVDAVQLSITRFKRMQDYAPALEAFNQILVSQGLEPMTSLQDQWDFMSGEAPAEVYDIWEASSVAEAAAAAGLGDVFTAEDAMAYAATTEGMTSLEGATSMFQEASKLLLRLRGEIDVGKFGLNQEDIIDMSLGLPPRSGVSASELQDAIQRAVSSATKSLQSRSKPFTGFTQTGTPQQQSLGSLRSS